MLDRAVARVMLLGALASACNARGSSDQETRPLPAPEPPPTTAPLAAAAPGEPPAKRSTASRAADSKRAEPAAEPAPASAQEPAAVSDAGVAAPASAKPEDAVQAPSAECIQKCQNALQGCLAAPTDGGVPGFSNVEVCKKAFETCQGSCAK